MSQFQAEEYVVLYAWEPENEGDLRLIAGETINVIEKNDHGWWNGIIVRNGVNHQGFFPKNYVRVKSAQSAPKPPPRPSADSGNDADQLARDVERIHMENRKSVLRQGPSFSLKTLAAFDELTEFGVCVELDSASFSEKAASSTYLTNGMRVEMKCSALLWDGASNVIQEFASGPLSFTIGSGQVTKGLNSAMARLRVGDVATITCSPSNAYGEAGNPPAVPPDSFVVYKVTILSAQPASSVDPKLGPVGPAAIIGSGVAASRLSKTPGNGNAEKRNSRIMLVYNANKANEGASSTQGEAPPPPTMADVMK